MNFVTEELYSKLLKIIQVSKRLQQELMSLMMSGDKGISAFPDGDTLLTWVATVTGPDDSVYEGKC